MPVSNVLGVAERGLLGQGAERRSALELAVGGRIGARGGEAGGDPGIEGRMGALDLVFRGADGSAIELDIGIVGERETDRVLDRKAQLAVDDVAAESLRRRQARLRVPAERQLAGHVMQQRESALSPKRRRREHEQNGAGKPSARKLHLSPSRGGASAASQTIIRNGWLPPDRDARPSPPDRPRKSRPPRSRRERRAGSS